MKRLISFFGFNRVGRPSTPTEISLRHIIAQGENIVSTIADFAAKQNAHNAATSAALDEIATSVDGLTGDVQTLNNKIEELQNSLGSISPEGQAMLDQIVEISGANVERAEALSAALAALDALTPPTPPIE